MNQIQTRGFKSYKMARSTESWFHSQHWGMVNVQQMESDSCRCLKIVTSSRLRVKWRVPLYKMTINKDEAYSIQWIISSTTNSELKTDVIHLQSENGATTLI